MIDHIEIENYRSLAKVSLSLGPLTVLIGPNNGGKSNLLDVFELLGEASKEGLAEAVARRSGFDSILYRGAQGLISFRLEFKMEGAFADEDYPITYRLELHPKGPGMRIGFEQVAAESEGKRLTLFMYRRWDAGCTFFDKLSGKREKLKGIESESELAICQIKDPTAYPIPYRVLRQLQDWRVYYPIDVRPWGPARRPAMIRTALRLAPSGQDVASVFYTIQQEHPPVWEEVEGILRNACPGFRRIAFPPEGGDGKVNLRWYEEPFASEYGFPISLISDGTLRLLALLAILKSPDPPPLVCIDEPELGLHPDWIRLVGDLLQEASTRTQVIVATHSAELVSQMSPENIVVCEREEGQSVLERLDPGELSKWIDKFSLGDLWLSGHIGGRP